MADARKGEANNGGQLPLQFPEKDPVAEPLIVSGPYAPIRRMLDRWRDWPEGQLALIGPSGSGKSRLAHQWAREVAGAFVEGEKLSKARISDISSLSVSALAIDDADGIGDGANLLAALNLSQEYKTPIMLTGESEPSSWRLDPPDLRSRLTAMPVIRIGLLDETAFKDRLMAACKARFMKMPEETAQYLLERMDRRHDTIERMAEALEIAADGKGLTKHAARKALQMIDAG